MAFNRPIVDQMVVDIGAAAFCRLAGYFMDETAAELKAIDALAAAARDLKEIGRRAHSLKNAAGSFGLADLAEVARGLEAACDSADLQATARAAGRLRAAYEAGKPDLVDMIAEVSARIDGQA